MIERHVKAVRVTAATSAIVAAMVILWVNLVTRDEPATIDRWPLALLVLPWLTFFGSFLLLIHHDWCRRPVRTFTDFLRRCFFWMFAACTAIIFGGIYGHFVFRIF